MKDMHRRLCLAALLLFLLLPVPAASARAQDCFAVETAESVMEGRRSVLPSLWRTGWTWRGFGQALPMMQISWPFSGLSLRAGFLRMIAIRIPPAAAWCAASMRRICPEEKPRRETGAMAVYLFKALPAPGKARIAVTIDQVYNGTVHSVGGSFSSAYEVEISNIPPANVRLLALEPSAGIPSRPFHRALSL